MSEALARAAWPDRGAVGRTIVLHVSTDPFRVIGVVAETRGDALAEAPQPEVYLPAAFWNPRRMTVAALVDGDVPAMLPFLREAVSSVDSEVTVTSLASMQSVLAGSITDSRPLTALLAAFAAVAMFLAVLGVYGITDVVVRRSTFAIGVHMAVGADRTAVIRGVSGHALAVCGAGMVTGVLLAAATGRVLESFLFEVEPLDPLVLGTVVAVLLAAAASAVLPVAFRASRIDPVTVLRQR